MFEKRATLGESFDNFNGLELEHTRYYEFNTVLVLWLLIACCLAFMVIGGEFYANTIDLLTI